MEPDNADASPESVIRPEAAASILTLVGEVVYDWTIGDDAIRWGDNAASVFGLPSTEPISTGHGYAALKDPTNLASRHDTIFHGGGIDRGEGVGYDVRYVLLPDGPKTSRRLIVEDIGRWFADAEGRPMRARGVIRVINERYDREQRVSVLSRYDELTGHYNRQHFLSVLGEAVANAKKTRRPVAFLLIALDNFGLINDAYGFDTGDEVFAAAARRIKAELRDVDSIGRYSGSKIGVILKDCDDAEMHAAAERLHMAVRNGVITTDISSVAATASIGGISIPRHATSVTEAIMRVRECLQLAQSRGYGRFAAYAPSPTRDARRRGNSALSSEMVAAVENNHLRLFFQPIVDIDTRKPVFYEGLLRLARADGTFAPAIDFIQICEQLGLIRLVDAFALSRAIETLVSVPDARIAINVSAETLSDGEWLSRLADAAAKHPGLARRLIVEITESAVIRNLDEIALFAHTIHDLGGSVAIDDFGAGFSSFRHLRSLDIDIVKIDGAFVENLPKSRDDLAFVRALTALAHTFDVRVVAEWVQNEETVALLKSAGVHLLQGLLTGAPVPLWQPATGRTREMEPT